jgi:preprotein translocase subunit Sss1
LSNGTKASFVIGAIGGFIIALIYTPRNLGWTFDDVPWDEPQFFLILTMALILISIGFFGLWRKSGNVIPLVSAICIIMWAITRPLLYYLNTYTTLLPVGFDPAFFLSIVAVIFRGVGWITAGISAWLLRNEFSQFSIVAALVFLALGAVNFLVFLIGHGDWWYWFLEATGIVTGIYFLDAART